MGGNGMSNGYDDIYFQSVGWAERVTAWLNHQGKAGQRNVFLDGNVELVRQVLEDKETGLRMVINIGAEALLQVLASGAYRNIYERPVIGGEARTPSPERLKVDQLLGFGGNAKNFYFGALALGGTGVRFYGEYCLAIQPGAVRDDTRLFDRDSYDLLLSPMKDRADQSELVKMLRGTWALDAVDMLTLKMLPEIREMHRLITVGSVSDLVMRDQEFAEIHKEGAITPQDIEEVRQSPDESAVEAVILHRATLGIAPTAVEVRWLEQRQRVIAALQRQGLRHRVVTMHGRGYQWK
jgi:hypothetical protein